MRTPLVILILGLVLFTGCTEDFASFHEPSSGSAFREGSQDKFRHAGLMDRAVKGHGKNGLAIGLIFKLDKQSILERYGTLDRYAVLERYATLERYNVLERYEYQHVFDGFAIWASADSVNGLIDEMVADPDIEWVEPDIEVALGPASVTPPTVETGQIVPWGVTRIGAYDYEVDHLSDVSVFVMDTGVHHDDLELEDTFDFTTGLESSSGIDTDGHGTHIAGIIGARNDADGVVGVAPGVPLHSLRVLTGDEVQDDGALDLSTAIAAVERVTAYKLENPNTPVVVNLSLGSDIGTTEYNALDDAIVASTSTGVTYVIAAGNQGIDAATVSPAHVSEAITVGAYDAFDQFASFSNHGPVVDILAPGTDIPSLNALGPGTGLMSGTSQATAFVSGAVALYLAQFPSATPAQVSEAIEKSGRDEITGAPSGTTSRTVYAGPDGGLVTMEIPPFLDFAVTANDDIEFTGAVTVTPEGEATRNANVLTNRDLKLDRDDDVIHGFGYYAGRLNKDRALAAFLPVINPTGLLPYQKLGRDEKAVVPDFDAAEYASRATQTTTGDLELSGHYTLGTESSPVIWYVNGKLGTSGAVTFSGYGVFVVKGGVELKHNLTQVDDAGMIGIYASGNIKVKNSGTLDLTGQWLSGNDVVIEGDVVLRGSITAAHKVVVKDGVSLTLYYRTADPALTDPFWPMLAQ